jgi:PAS domain S-box-containing protein
MQLLWFGFEGQATLFWLPERASGYVLLALYVVALGYVLLRELWVLPEPGAPARRGPAVRLPRLSRQEWAVLLGLTVAAFVLAQVLVVRPEAGSLPLAPGLARETPSPAAPVLGSVPIVLAAAWFGPLGAVLAGLASGLSRALWGQYRATLIFDWIFYAVMVAFCLRQDYRGREARWLRRPLLATLLAAVPFVLLEGISIYVYTPPGDVQTTYLNILDYLVNLTAASLPGLLLELFVAGALAEIAYRALPALRPARQGLVPWPFELSLRSQLLAAFVPAIFVFTALLLLAQMTQAVNVATQVGLNQMELAARDAARGLPFFLTTGRSLLTAFAHDDRLVGASPQAAQALLDRQQRTVAYFQTLALFDLDLKPIAVYPPVENNAVDLSHEEQQALEVVRLTNAVQETPVHSGALGHNAISFATSVLDARGEPVALLLGRTTLDDNPMMSDITASLQNTLKAGSGFVVDGRGLVVAHPDKGWVLQPWRIDENLAPRLPAPGKGTAYQGVAPDGTREMLYVQSVEGTDWLVVVSVPYEVVLQLAADLAQPTIVLIVLAAILAIGGIYYLSRRVTRPLGELSRAAGNIAGGNLDTPVAIEAESEVGQLGAAFERMRLGLKARLEELVLLLEVTQNVAASLDLERGLPPVLNGALKATEAAGVRVTLLPTENRRALSFGAGPLGAAMEPLDADVISLARGERLVQIENVARQHALLEPGALAGRLQAVIALPLRTQERLDGVLWLGYTAPHRFTETEVAFLTTLAGEASVVLENARLFETAEGGRRRLAAILASTTDPVIVTDRGDRMLLLNPAAQAAFEIDPARVTGRPVAESVADPGLVELLAGRASSATHEVKLPDGRTFYASASPIVAADGQVLGRVAVLRDITAIKALDEMKSEFVATVSHDLRGPLSSMRGFATMLSVVGELNPKQTEYAGKIVGAIEQMSQLIEDLLDLGRIEAGVGLAREFCDIETLVGQVVETLRVQAVAKGLTLKLEVTAGIPPVSGDPTLLRQAVMNLVDNAVKYTPSGGTVTVRAFGRGRAGTRPDEVLVAVQDTGIGIAPADQLRLYEKFYRIKRRDTLNIKGTGLGLAIVKSIAERHGGRAWVESRLGEGSTFFIGVPLN